jgi:MFS transporter, ACS family, allantoate permease
MSTSVQPLASEASESELKNRYSKDDEKIDVETTIKDGDEALKLVGNERRAHFSEEYNRKLRKKLVGIYIA